MSIERTREHQEEMYDCGGGSNAFAIDPQGRLSICVLSHVDTYDLRKGSFRGGWEQFLYKVRRKPWTRLTKCVECSLKGMCGMCPANGELEHGDPEAPVDFLCQTAHLRALALGFEVPPHGACEYCEGGTGYPDLVQSLAALQNGSTADRIASNRNNIFLPLVGEANMASGGGCSSGGCSSCGLAAVHQR
jgi:radical SAM protein with 4Fe4S-binding SPASM domain